MLVLLLLSCAPTLAEEAGDLRGHEAWGNLSAFATSPSEHLLMTLWCECNAELVDSLTTGNLDSLSLDEGAAPTSVHLSAYLGDELYWAVVPDYYAEGEQVAPHITAEYEGSADRITVSFLPDVGGLGPGLLFEFESLTFEDASDNDVVSLGDRSWSARYSKAFDADVTRL